MRRAHPFLAALPIALLFVAGASANESARYAEPNQEAGDDRQLCDQKEQAHVAMMACTRLLLSANIDAKQKTRIHERRGQAAFTLFYFGEAAEDFTQVLNAEPEHLQALAGRAEAFNEEGEFVRSAEDWALLASKRPDDVAARIHLGKNHFAAGAYEKSVAAYQEAAKLDAQNVAAYVGLGRAYDMLDKHDKSAESLETALKINPTSTAALMARGEIAEKRGNIKLAVESYMLSLKHNGMQIKPRQALQRLGVETPP